jgi:hypothetical protein
MKLPSTSIHLERDTVSCMVSSWSLPIPQRQLQQLEQLQQRQQFPHRSCAGVSVSRPVMVRDYQLIGPMTMTATRVGKGTMTAMTNLG